MTAGIAPHFSRWHLSHRLPWWAITICAIPAGAMAAAGLLVLAALAAGGSDAIRDTWVSATAAVLIEVTVVLSFVSFVMAVTAKVKRQATRPLATFPAVITLLALGELFWWE